MGLFDRWQERSEKKELRTLYNRLQPYMDKTEKSHEELCKRVISSVFNISTNNPPGIIEARAWKFCQAMLVAEGYLSIPSIDINRPMAISEVWATTAAIKRTLDQF